MILNFKAKERGAHVASLSLSQQQATAPTAPGIVIAHCTRQGCRFRASARREAAALRGVAAHFIATHMEPKGAA